MAIDELPLSTDWYYYRYLTLMALSRGNVCIVANDGMSNSRIRRSLFSDLRLPKTPQCRVMVENTNTSLCIINTIQNSECTWTYRPYNIKGDRRDTPKDRAIQISIHIEKYHIVYAKMLMLSTITECLFIRIMLFLYILPDELLDLYSYCPFVGCLNGV